MKLGKNTKIVAEKNIILGGEKVKVFMLKQEIKKRGWIDCDYTQFRIYGEFLEKNKKDIQKERLIRKFSALSNGGTN